MKQLSVAESAAKNARLGMWSEAGMKGRSPPRDSHLIGKYRDHPEWFARLSRLVRDDRRLRAVSRDPATWAAARDAGVAPYSIDEYLDRLGKLDANEQLTDVAGSADACLIVSDILYGMFDNGVIKGYVLSPFDPRPLVKDLENWPPELVDATIAYRRVAEQWYLFEIHH
jgi:hypothetical protein